MENPLIIESIDTPTAPAAIGPYSQAKKIGDFVFLSGQLPVDPASRKVVSQDISGQTTQVLTNLAAVISEAGGGLESIVKTTCYLSNIENFERFNEVYNQYFHSSMPARACVEVSRLPLGVLCEIDAVAFVSDSG